MPLDATTTNFLSQMGAAGFKPFHQCTPGEARAAISSLTAMSGPGPEMAKVNNYSLDAETGTFGVRVLVPNQAPHGIIVYYHGGGWVFGTLDDFDTVARRLAERSGCAVVMVDYRLAPEYRYPAAADDAYAALLWASENATEIAGAQVPLIVVGDSAGGNLAAVTALRARDREGPEVALQVLIYPVTDASLEHASYTNPEYQLLLTRDDMAWFWDHYVPEAERRAEPDASPFRASNLEGLPPTVLITAEYDVTRDDSEAYGARLKAAGIEVEHSRYEGETHGFFTLLMLRGGERAIEQVATAIRRQLGT
jgi:acetyl esterase